MRDRRADRLETLRRREIRRRKYAGTVTRDVLTLHNV